MPARKKPIDPDSQPFLFSLDEKAKVPTPVILAEPVAVSVSEVATAEVTDPLAFLPALAASGVPVSKIEEVEEEKSMDELLKATANDPAEISANQLPVRRGELKPLKQPKAPKPPKEPKEPKTTAKRPRMTDEQRREASKYASTVAPATVDDFEMTPLRKEMLEFNEFGTATILRLMTCKLPEREQTIPMFVNEYWTAKMRAAHSLHEVPYRACFKPQLPNFFIKRLTKPGDVVYDPFMGRGTTPLEAAMMGRTAWGADANPLSLALVNPRFQPPTVAEIEECLANMDLTQVEGPLWEELLVFYDRKTLIEITALRQLCIAKEAAGTLTNVEAYIRMVALNRLTGHSAGFFSVYSLPPNQAVSIASQIRINENRNQVPTYRNVKQIILKKGKQLLRDLTAEERTNLKAVAPNVRTLCGFANQPSPLPANSVDLVVTSPPFLNVVQYAIDNWLRCWFIGLDAQKLNLSTPGRLPEWQGLMKDTLQELHRLLKPGGHIAFEVGEVQGGFIALDEYIAPLGLAVGLEAELVLINQQDFTKTANCWGVDNQAVGTNTNRIVLFRKPL